MLNYDTPSISYILRMKYFCGWKVTNMPLGTVWNHNNFKQCEAKLKKVIHKYMPQIFVRFNREILQISLYV
jgi:hypothetical protein